MIAVMFSGGVDSTVCLAMAVSKFGPDQVEAVSVMGTKYIPYAERIVREFFPDISWTRRYNPRKDTRTEQVVEHLLSCKYDLVMLGTTTNPPVVLPGSEPKRVDPRKVESNERLYVPFLRRTKDFVINYAYKCEISHMLPYTRSCTEADPDTPPCGRCWQCSERKWAFDKLGKTDEQKWSLGWSKD